MKATRIRPHVSHVFPAPGQRTTGVAVEHELLTVDRATGGVVPIRRILAATAGSTYARHLSFEPGGQVELSLPSQRDAAAVADQLGSAVTALRADCAAAGVDLVEAPLDVRWGVPLQRTTPRYLAMQQHFDAVGPAGRTMMRRTASTQPCLDWWSGAPGLEQWRLLNLAGPFLAAATARSVGRQSRLATWLQVDPARTAFDGRLVEGDDPVAAYSDFAAGAAVFTGRRDVARHLTTLFPPVRPRGRYLEVRFFDVQPTEQVGALVGALATLLYDDQARRRASAMVEGAGDLEELWWRAALGDDELVQQGDALLDMALASAA